jgi:hypothetical protein
MFLVAEGVTGDISHEGLRVVKATAPTSNLAKASGR